MNPGDAYFEFPEKWYGYRKRQSSVHNKNNNGVVITTYVYCIPEELHEAAVKAGGVKHE